MVYMQYIDTFLSNINATFVIVSLNSPTFSFTCPYPLRAAQAQIGHVHVRR